MSEATVESIAQVAAEIINTVMAERRDLIKQLHAAKVELAARHHASVPTSTCPVPDHGMPCGNPMPCAVHLADDLRCVISGCNRRIAPVGKKWYHAEARQTGYDHQATPPLDVLQPPRASDTNAAPRPVVCPCCGCTTISPEDYQRELHSGHMLSSERSTFQPVGVKPGWMWCVKRGCTYTTPSNAHCKVHGRMDACWAEADGGGKETR